MKTLTQNNLDSWKPLVEEVALNYAGNHVQDYEDAVQEGWLRLVELLDDASREWKPEHVVQQLREAVGSAYRQEAIMPSPTSESDLVLTNDDGSVADNALEMLASHTVSTVWAGEWAPYFINPKPYSLECGHVKALDEWSPFAICPDGCGEPKVGKRIKTIEGEPFSAHEDETVTYDNSRDRDLDPNWLNTFGSFEDSPDYSDGLGPGPNSPLSYLPPTHEQCTGDKRTTRMNEWYAAIEGEEKGRYWERSDFQIAKVKALLAGQGPWFANVLAYAKTFPYRGPALPVKAIRGSGLALEDGSSISLAKAWRCWTGLRFGSPERTEKFCALLEEHFPSNRDAQNISRALRSK
jgi:hypothetical protein